jgi:hypothetical protein
LEFGAACLESLGEIVPGFRCSIASRLFSPAFRKRTLAMIVAGVPMLALTALWRRLYTIESVVTQVCGRP